MSIQLFHGDTNKIIHQIADNSIDLLLTDPPYRYYKSNNRKKNPFKPIMCDTYNPNELINQTARVLKPGAHFYIWCDDKHYPVLFDFIQSHPSLIFKNCLVWIKRTHGIGDIKRSYYITTEFIIFGGKINELGKINPLIGKRLSNVFTTDEKNLINTYHHPTPKPIDVLKKLIEHSCNVGDTVLDMYAGSGTTLLACQALGRSAIGIEMEESYVQGAKNHLGISQ